MIEAIDDKIIVEYLRTTKTESGLIIPDNAQDPQGYGRVLSVGDKIKDIKKGSILVFHARAGMDMLMDDVVQKCIKIDEVYGILNDKKLIKRLEPLRLKAKSNITVPPEKKIIT